MSKIDNTTPAEAKAALGNTTLLAYGLLCLIMAASVGDILEG